MINAEISYSQAFSEFAEVYDRFMHYIDYPGWVRYILEIIELFEIRGRRLLDIACGTGTCALLFAREGFEVTGIDISQQMLEQARKKIQNSGYRISLFQQDMREFKIDKRVDIATCLYDSLNYLLQTEDLQRTFVSVHRALEENGAFIFDMNTEYALKVVWGTNVWHRKEGGIASVWKSEFDLKTGIGTLYLTWRTEENGMRKKHHELHQERAYSAQEIRRLLEKAGFRRVEIYAHLTFQPPVEVTPRIMVVAVK